MTFFSSLIIGIFTLFLFEVGWGARTIEEFIPVNNYTPSPHTLNLPRRYSYFKFLEISDCPNFFDFRTDPYFYNPSIHLPTSHLLLLTWSHSRRWSDDVLFYFLFVFFFFNLQRSRRWLRVGGIKTTDKEFECARTHIRTLTRARGRG